MLLRVIAWFAYHQPSNIRLAAYVHKRLVQLNSSRVSRYAMHWRGSSTLSYR